MKKLLFVMLMYLIFTGPCFAVDSAVFVKWGKFEVNIPMKNLKVIPGLYDIWQGQGLLGAETQLMAFSKLNLNFGCVTSFIGNGTPFISLDSNMTEIIPNIASFLNSGDSLYLGPWLGYDFELKDWRAGIKSSIKLW